MRRFRRKNRSWRSGKSEYDRYYRTAASAGRRRRSWRARWADVPAETKRGIVSIVLLGFGLCLLLALVGLAGPASPAVQSLLAEWLGAMRWVLPPAILALGYRLARPDTVGWLPVRFLGGVLAFLGGAVLLHGLRYAVGADVAASGRGGGMVGQTLASALVSSLGVWVTLIIAGGVTVTGGLLFFQTSFTRAFQLLAAAGTWLASLRQHWIRRRVRQLEAERERPAAVSVPPVSRFEPRDVPVAMEIEESGDADGAAAAETETDAGPAAGAPAVKRRARAAPRLVDMPLTLLTGQAGKPTSGDIKANQYLVEKTLKNFGIDVEMGEVSVGPTVTQYTFKPAEGVKLSKIVSLSDNLALALAAHPIRIEAPIPGRSLVGLEVPNQTTAVVPLRAMLDSDEYRKRGSNVMVALGSDVKGKPWLADLARMPHLMIAGATGSGKSVCINTLILSLLFQNGPDDLKFIMVDPKRVELPLYTGIPHLITPVITDVKKTINALRWCIGEMERRFDTLAASHKRDIAAYNQATAERMPFLVIVIDELADLMAAAGPEIEGSIIRLAQMSRAVGIHLVIATQRPSVDVLTGLIKANITSRIAFSVASLVDSRTILDMSGAEKLLGRGDMLYLSAEISKPKRLQGAYATDAEIKRVIDHLKAQASPEYIDDVVAAGNGSGVGAEGMFGSAEPEENDALLESATDVCVRAGKASASLLQRRLRIGYARAARILDALEARGVVGPVDGAKPREVLLRPEHGDDTIDHAAENSADENADSGNPGAETL